MISLKQINKQYVEAIPIPDEDLRPILGADIVEEVYSNIFLCARKKSGKTSAVFKILKECSDRKTVIVIFCSTAYKDKNWIQIRKYFTKKGMEVRVFTSIYENGEDQLANLVDDLKQEAKDLEDDPDDHHGGSLKDEEPVQKDVCDMILERLTSMHLAATGGGLNEMEKAQRQQSEKQSKKKKSKKAKFLAPEYMIIFDDLSSELKSRSLLSLLKFNRHFKAKLIISSQWLHDLLPESRKQIDLFLIFKGFSDKKLMDIHRKSGSSIPFAMFNARWKKATQFPHSFS